MIYIKDGIFRFPFPDGEMTLVMDKFFPASKSTIRLLFKNPISLSYFGRKKAAEEIIQWLNWKKDELNRTTIECGKKEKKIKANIELIEQLTAGW